MIDPRRRPRVLSRAVAAALAVGSYAAVTSLALADYQADAA